MIDILEIFQLIGQDGCLDPATSLVMQGIDTSMSGLSFPLIEPVYVKLLFGQDSQFMCNSMQELAILNKLRQSCGTVTAALNILDIEQLTIAGMLFTSTPNSGINVFMKLTAFDIVNMPIELLDNISDITGIPIPGTGLMENFTGIAEKLVDGLIDKVIDILNDKFTSNRINLRDWDELPDFYDWLVNSGEMREMHKYRCINHCGIL